MAFVAGLSEFYGVLFLVAGFFFAAGGIYIACQDAKTYDQRVAEFTEEMKRSIERMSDPDYISAMLEAGLEVPTVYVEEARKKLKARRSRADPIVRGPNE